MKITLVLFFITLTSFTNEISNDISGNGLDNGWYEATVYYTNYSTGTYATYTLDVYVEYDDVIEIDFGNEGSVHSGVNNSGYYYSSEYLDYEYDYEGNFISATSTVTLNYDNGTMVTFEIEIE